MPNDLCINFDSLSDNNDPPSRLLIDICACENTCWIKHVEIQFYYLSSIFNWHLCMCKHLLDQARWGPVLLPIYKARSLRWTAPQLKLLEQKEPTLDQQPCQEEKTETPSKPCTRLQKSKPTKRHRDPSTSAPRVPGEKVCGKKECKLIRWTFLIACMHDS